MTQGVVDVVNTTNRAYPKCARAYPKGIYHLHKLLLKNGEALTEAGSLVIGYLRIPRRNLLWLGHLGNFYFAKCTQNRFRPRLFCTN